MLPRKLYSAWTTLYVSAFLFALLTALSTTGWMNGVDRMVMNGLRGDALDLEEAGPSWTMEFMRDLTSLAGVGIVVVVAFFVLVYQLLGGAWRAAIVTVVVIVGAQISNSWLKLFISRPRPDLFDHGAHVFTHSYPSGHATMAAAVTLTLTWFAAGRQTRTSQRVFCWGVGIGGVLLIGFTRMYLGVHWLSDVTAGWCLGTFWAAVGRLLARQLRSGVPRRLEDA